MKRLVLILLLVNGSVIAQSELSYQTPPKLIADLVDAPRRPGAPSIVELAQPEEKVIISDLPEGKVMNVAFSPDSKNLAFILETNDDLSLWNYRLKRGYLWRDQDRVP